MEQTSYINSLKNELKSISKNIEVKSPIVSIIVPAYNVDFFISDCLKSLIKQTFEDIEIICINDGSTDNTKAIILTYAEFDSRIKYIEQENQGLSAVRNKGIELAQGDYILFIDSDDWVDENFVETLYQNAKEYDADIATASILRHRDRIQKYRIKYDKTEVLTDLKDKLEACAIPKCCYVWNKLYKKELIKANRFTEGVFYEDVLWTPKILKQSNKLVTVTGTQYYYRVNKNSIVKKPQSIKKQEDSYNSKKYIIKFFEENNIPLPRDAKNITKRIYYLANIPIVRVKEVHGYNIHYLFNILPFYIKKV